MEASAAPHLELSGLAGAEGQLFVQRGRDLIHQLLANAVLEHLLWVDLDHTVAARACVEVEERGRKDKYIGR